MVWLYTDLNTMRIDGSNNSFMTSNIARAYGVPQARQAQPAIPTQPVAGVESMAFTPRLPTNAQSLVAGHVRGSVEFDGVSVPRSNPASLNLYTRAADRIEAATAVQIGRTIDVKG